MTTAYVTIVASLPEGDVRGAHPVPIDEAQKYVHDLNKSLEWPHRIEPIEFCLCALCRLIVVRARAEGREIKPRPLKRKRK